jgi:hypothetical protein
VSEANGTTVLELGLPAVSDDVNVRPAAPGALGFAVHEYVDDSNGPPTGVESVSELCVHPVVAIAGKVAAAGPESASVTVLTSVNEPAVSPL